MLLACGDRKIVVLVGNDPMGRFRRSYALPRTKRAVLRMVLSLLGLLIRLCIVAFGIRLCVFRRVVAVLRPEQLVQGKVEFMVLIRNDLAGGFRLRSEALIIMHPVWCMIVSILALLV